MTRADTHLVLVDEQLLPNLTPALDPDFRPKEVCLLVAPEMSEQADRLSRLIRSTGVRVSAWPVASAWDVVHIRERVSSFLEDRDGHVVLNASTGTRPMNLGAFEAFRAAGKDVFCVQQESDHVVWLSPAGRASHDLADSIRLPAFLAARDLRLVSAVRQGVPEHLRQLTRTLLEGVERCANALTTLNWLAAGARQGSLLSPPMRMEQARDEVLSELLGLFAAHGLFAVTADLRLQFRDEAARFYVNGGWLEEHVFSVLQELRKEVPLQDLARSVVVEWDEEGSPVSNEIDVVFLVENRLHLIECKSKRFDADRSPDSLAAATLYKLDTLRSHLGGDEARAMLVSYRGSGMHSHARAKELKVEICEGENIRAIKNWIVGWISCS